MKKILFISFLLLFVCTNVNAQDTKGLTYDSLKGEQIDYHVRSLGMHAANAILTFEGKATLEGKEVYLITFEAKGSNFLDSEKIYADSETLYPIRVVRDLNIFGTKEKIVESYDQKKFVVNIEKKVKGKKPEKTVIQKKGKIDNIYCFIYRFRINGKFKIGNSIKMNLPTKDVSVKIAQKKKMKAAGKVYPVYYLHTVPSQYKLWLEADNVKIPIRIDKPAAIGGTSMRMDKYKSPK